jgi:hypothetical protein
VRKVALLLGLFALAPASRAADDEGARSLTVEVGEKAPVDGLGPVCDDPSVAKITGEESLSVVGVGPGTTQCAVRLLNGARVLYKVVVVEKKQQK